MNDIDGSMIHDLMNLDKYMNECKHSTEASVFPNVFLFDGNWLYITVILNTWVSMHMVFHEIGLFL